MTIARLGGFDTSFLFLEFGPQTMNISTLIELDFSTAPDGYSYESLRRYLLDRMDALPELRVKLADTRLNLDNPVWAEDPDFNLDRHLHRVALPAPGGRSQLSEVAANLIPAPLDRSRPLWELWVIEDASAPGRPINSRAIALLLKQHHAIMDGASDTDLMSRLCTTDVARSHPDRIAGPDTLSTGQIAVDGALRFVQRPAHIVMKLLPTIARGVVNSMKLSARGLAMASPLRTPATRFNGNISGERSVAFLQLDLADVMAVKTAFGVKVNDVVLALISGALRGYLADLGELPAEALTALVPVAVNDRTETGGANQLSAAFCSLQTHIADPAERLKAIAQASVTAKKHSTALGPTILQDTLQYVSPRILGWVLRLYVWSGIASRRPLFNVAISNVPAPPVQWYLSGAKVTAMYGIPPVMHGVGLNAGVSSLNGKLEVGLVSCRRLLPDLWNVADRLPDVLAELLDAAS
ncbi:WS/DGAT/MGAT family O-acyltransferase [Mycobacterium sp. SMC-4]|uniref:WS/DGAT/MGAT family O-acyltransferase n=1 Tax=Mycobacterium sp. SMC-4 TaxID=2857059 RepID=UPI003D05E3D0